MGTGTGDMIRRCRDAGLKEPDFQDERWFHPRDLARKSLRRCGLRTQGAGWDFGGKFGGNFGGNVGEKPGKILRLMKERPKITAQEIVGILKLTKRAIELQIQRLKAEEIISCVGPAKGGHWEVLR